MAIGSWKPLGGRGGRGGRSEQMPALQALGQALDDVSASSIGGAVAAIRAADAARDRRDWPIAAEHYREALAIVVDDAGLWVQFGHAVKEGGDPAAAETAYRRALAIDPSNADTHLQLGHVLKIRGQRDAAIAAYAEAARRDPSDPSSQRELVHLGARDLLPEAASRSTAMWQRLSAVGAALAEGAAARRDWIGGAAYPLAAYDRFRRDIPVRPPPGPLPRPDSGALVVLIDASSAAPFLVRATLRSLQDQSVRTWQAVVVASVETRAHPVASFADVDARIAFVAADDAVDRLAHARHVVSLVAGTVLDGEALAWLVFAADRTGARAIFADHDHGVSDALLGIVRAEPWLPGGFEPLHHGEDPAVVMADAAIVRTALAAHDAADGSFQRRLLAHGGPAAHVARLLGTRLDLLLAARGGTSEDGDAEPGRLGAAPTIAAAARQFRERDDRIAVVIPTRDSPALLGQALASLRRTARDAGRIELIVVDNGSASGSGGAIADIAAQNDARITAMPGPFNWSRASNLGAGQSTAPLIVFANDDIEMLTMAWDDIVADALASDDIGAIGVRLLYPDRSVQHVGMVFGLAQGRPEHEGRRRRAEDAGPDGRWHARRSVAAVTGAFMAVRRDRFIAVDGFDAERLFIAHSDVDLCLKLRETGLRIVYVPEIEAIHAESQTRGQDETKAQVAWDEAERLDLVDRWGSALAEDPGVSPYWALGGVPFDGLREPSLREVVRHLDITARDDPWRPTRRIEQEAQAWRADALI